MSIIEEAIKRASDTKALEMGVGAMAKTGEMFRNFFPGKEAVIVADTNTIAAAGDAVRESLASAGIRIADEYIFDDPDLHGEWKYVEMVEAFLAKYPGACAVAVGSGVINDLTKLSSDHLGQRYIIVGTAASMDGYTAYGASIEKDGNKQTFSCKAPLGVVCDPYVSAVAPKELVASGYADLLAKIPAGSDWMISDLVKDDPMDDFAFSLVQGNLRKSLSDPEAARRGEVEPTQMLLEGLMMSGFAMQAIQSSRPASGIEHMVSHYWDMEGLCYQGKHVSHGFKVGIGTLISTAFYEFVLNNNIVENMDVDACVAAWPTWDELEARIREIYKDMPKHLAKCLMEAKNKYKDADGLRTQLTALKEGWAELRPRIEKQNFSFEHVYDCLRKVGAPYEPEMIGVSREKMKTTYYGLPFMRSRFTILDVIHRSGNMDKCADFLFGSGGHWEIK